MGANAHFVDGRWAVFYRQKNARWAAKMPDEKTAKLAAKDAEKRMRAGEDLRPDDRKPAKAGAPAPVGETFRDFALRWLALTWDTRANNTNESYEMMLRLHLFPVLGDTVLTTIDRAVCIDAVSTLVGKHGFRTKQPLSRRTRGTVLRTLSVVLQAAVDRGRLPFNPAFRLGRFVKSKTDATKAIPPVWTAAETARLLAVIQQDAPRWHPFFKIAFRTGLRGGELVELQWDKDFQKPHKLHVQRGFTTRKSATVRVEQGRLVKERVFDDGVGPTKGKRSREVDLTIDVEAAFAEQRSLQRAEAFKRGKPSSPLVFTTPRLGRRVNIANLQRRKLSRWCRLANVPYHTLHATRHTYASVLLTKGVEVDYVSHQLGHRQLTTTQEIYRHWLPDGDADRQRVARLDGLWVVKKEEGQ